MAAAVTLCLSVSGVLATPALAAEAAPSAIQKTIKRLVGAIRYGKDDLAAQQIAFAPMAHSLLGEATWQKMSNAEKQEFTAGLEKIIRNLSFPKGRGMFEHLDAMLYEEPRVQNGTAVCKSTVVIHRNYKAAEVVIEWVLKATDNTWKVVDTIILGESTAAGVREDQVEPLLNAGGIPALMQALRNKLKEL